LVSKSTLGADRPAKAKAFKRVASLLARRELQLIVAITAGAAVLRFISLGVQSLWYDETVTASLVQNPLGGMLRLLPSSETAPPLYYVVAWAWVRIFGSSDLTLRSLSAVAGTLTVPVVYAAARVLVSHRAGLIAATLATCSPLLVWYSQEARAYSLLLLLSSLSLLAFALAWRKPASKHVAWWAVVSCLAIATYYYAVFLALAEAAVLFSRYGRHRAIGLATAAIVLVSSMLLPLAAVQARTSNAAWIHSIPLSSRVEETIRQLVTPAPAPRYAGASDAGQPSRNLWIIAVVLLALALVAALRYGSRRERDGALVGLTLGVAVISVPLVISIIGPFVFDERGDVFLYRAVLPAWTPLAIVVASGFGARHAPALALLGAAVLAAASLAVTLAIAVDGDLQRDDVRAVAAATKGKGVIIVFPAFERRALLHYRPDLEAAPSGDVNVREIELLIRGSPSVARFRPRRPFALVEKRRIQHFMLQRYRSPSVVRLDAHQLSVLKVAGYAVISRREAGQLAYSLADPERVSRRAPRRGS
jgi:mannosyltransferase